MTIPHIPAGQGAVAPFFLVADAAGMIAFLKEAFDGEERSRIEGGNGVILHASIDIGGSVVMVGTRPKTYENSTHLYVPNVDATFRRCLALGAEALSEPTTYPYGDRSAGIRDPFGNVWWIGTHLSKP